MDRRGVLEFVGGIGCGTLLGYYVGAKQLLGIQSATQGSTDPVSTETPTGESPTTTEQRTDTSEPTSGTFEDQFRTSETGYDPEKWRVIKKTRFDGQDVSGDRFTQTGDDQLRMAPQSYESVYLESQTTFGPPVRLTVDIASASHNYGSAADLGFAMPGETYPGRGGERSGRGRMFKWTTDSVQMVYGQDGGVNLGAQTDSPLHNDGDTGQNQSGDGSWNGDIANTEATLEWTAESVSLRVGDRTFEVTENVPTEPMPLYLTGIEWVGSAAVDMTFNSVTVEQL